MAAYKNDLNTDGKARSNMRTTRLLASVAWVAVAATAFVGGAHAQSGEDTSADTNDTIIVTGTRIRGIDPTGSNVISVGQKEIESTSVLTTQDLINQIPQNVVSGLNEGTYSTTSSGVNVTRAGAVNLRGIGPSATLPLLDGHRIVPNGTSGRYIDPSAIPVNAIERVEVVADGASAIYGADAVAGVYNVVMRRSLNGVEMGGTYGFADGMDQWSTVLAAGKTWSGGQIMVVYEHTDRSNLAGRDRSWYTSDNRDKGGTDYRSIQCNPGTIVIGGVNYPIPSGTVTPASLTPGAPNRCDLTPYNDILPSQNREVVAATLTQDLTDWLEFSAMGLFMDRRFSGEFIAQGPTSLQRTLQIGPGNPYRILPAGVAPSGAPLAINYSFLPEYGPLESFGYEKTHEIVAGFNVSLPYEWKAWIGGVYGKNHAVQSNRNLNPVALGMASNTPNPAAALNPFGPNSRDLIDGIFSWVFQPDGLNKMHIFEFRADGPLFELPAGSVRAAIGYEHGKTEHLGGTFGGPIDNPTRTPIGVERTVNSVFGEVYIPVFDTDALGKLELSGALRYDDYSDFGSTTNPKAGLTYKPTQSLSFNASYGTSFRAPDLDNILLRKPVSFVSYGTRLDPTRGNTMVPVVVLIAGNPELEAETATTWSLGATFQPDSLPGFRANLNYFNLVYKNQITAINSDPAVLQRRSDYGSLIREFTPPLSEAQVLADPLVASLIAAGVPTLPNPFPGLFYIIDGRPYNVGKTKTDGLDFDFSYTTAMGNGDLTTRIAGSYFFSFDVQQTSIAAVEDQLNQYPYPLRLKMRGSLAWENDKYGLGAYVNFANSYNNPISTNVQKVDAYTTLDLHASVNLDVLLGKTTLALDVKNVFDTDPPFVDVEGGYDPGNASAIGRLVTLSVRTRF